MLRFLKHLCIHEDERIKKQDFLVLNYPTRLHLLFQDQVLYRKRVHQDKLFSSERMYQFLQAKNLRLELVEEREEQVDREVKSCHDENAKVVEKRIINVRRKEKGETRKLMIAQCVG